MTARAGLLVLLLVAFGGLVRPTEPATAACSYPIPPLADVTRQAESVVIADVIRELPDASLGYPSMLRVVGVIKGRSTGPIVRIDGLGHLQDDCQGGPRLTRGNRYVLFISHEGEQASTAWSLVGQEGGVYRLANDGVRFPPEHPLGQPQTVALSSADFVRDVGTVAGVDQSRIEALVEQLALPESFQKPPTRSSGYSSVFDHLPTREASLAIAAGAVLIASLLFLLWRPADPHARGRP